MTLQSFIMQGTDSPHTHTSLPLSTSCGSSRREALPGCQSRRKLCCLSGSWSPHGPPHGDSAAEQRPQRQGGVQTPGHARGSPGSPCTWSPAPHLSQANGPHYGLDVVQCNRICNASHVMEYYTGVILLFWIPAPSRDNHTSDGNK